MKKENKENKQLRAANFQGKMQKLVTPKALAVFLTISYIISLIPLLLIANYNYPSADDYSNGSHCYQIWTASHSVLQTLWGAVERAADTWLNWMGYFTANFLTALPPAVFGEQFHMFAAWIILGMFSLSTIYLLRVIFVQVFQGDKYVSLCAAMLMLLVSVQCMAGRMEAFYWWSGAAGYTFVHGMTLFYYGLLISAVYDKGKKRIWDLTAASVLGFLSGGGNHMSALNVVIVLLTATAFITCQKKWKSYRALLIPMGAFFIGFLLNVAAPGNRVRAGGSGGMNPVKAVFVSLYYGLDYCLSEWTGWPVLVLIAALVPLFFHMTKKTNFSFRYPLFVVLYGYCLVSAMVTPPVFAVGNMEAGRIKALAFSMYILVLTLCVGYVTGWVRKKIEAVYGQAAEKKVIEAENFSALPDRFTMNEILCLLGCILMFGMAAVMTVIPEPHYFSATSAMTDLINGNAKAYEAAHLERAAQYHSGEKDVVVKPLPVQPQMLYFSDIQEDPEYWENRVLCRYYGLDSVRVEKKNKE